ncbi:4'-phosphopantetheinyl transferase superfamily protein [Nonomuraea phyllanthi]|uniref:4'-phosphopantetheinyl transferase superfamily protein n=1 Tax=Nonomuraea phyllanthi TaxID=2219224 RepID=A0A5C4WQU9_9ACTN|nr:4'-phosphopantetheinyl transferase superfamily protein [Nonomuraea phyllanthi]KAB8196053.1 4'-phosphopantetheinyl transferase superfamily protein [Nonomuraea phyllanthi]QFY07512.1 4'-phosphopantetheinyl transferase superfamily protein [Nonomuraea phyllanthi]
MIEAILPRCVVAADLFHDPPDATLFPEEEKVIEESVEKRRREFATARLCARTALGRLGLPPAPVLPGLRGEPQWPHGVVGSITHCAGYRGAVLGDATKVATVGIDAEPNDALANGVLEAVSLPEERAHLHRLSALHPHVSWDRMLFSAKESVYKAWYPLAKRWLDFEDAVITFQPATGTFSARLLVRGPRVDGRRLDSFSGRWLVDRGLIVTAIVIPR